MALYVSQAELKTVSLDQVIIDITDNDSEIVETIIEETTDLFKSYLHGIYNTDTIFSQIGDDRSKILMKYMKDVIVYEIYIRKTIENNEVAKLRYDEAIMWLDKVSKGQLVLDLPYAGGEDADGDGNPDGDLFLSAGKTNYTSRF